MLRRSIRISSFLGIPGAGSDARSGARRTSSPPPEGASAAIDLLNRLQGTLLGGRRAVQLPQSASSLFRRSQQNQQPGEEMLAGAAGFEPANAGTKSPIGPTEGRRKPRLRAEDLALGPRPQSRLTSSDVQTPLSGPQGGTARLSRLGAEIRRILRMESQRRSARGHRATAQITPRSAVPLRFRQIPSRKDLKRALGGAWARISRDGREYASAKLTIGTSPPWPSELFRGRGLRHLEPPLGSAPREVERRLSRRRHLLGGIRVRYIDTSEHERCARTALRDCGLGNRKRQVSTNVKPRNGHCPRPGK